MAVDSAEGDIRATKTRVFISYSRKDMPFADRLEATLKARGFEPLIDREGGFTLSRIGGSESRR